SAVISAVTGVAPPLGGAVEHSPGGSGPSPAGQGEGTHLYAEEGTAAPTCTLYTPDGARPDPGTYQSSTRSLGDTSWESFDSFTAPSSGEYEIDCAGMPVAVGPPVSIGGILGAVGGILFAIGGGFLGFVLLAIGIVLWLLNRKKTA